MRKKKIAVAMSGGIDSSYAAYLLKQEGHAVEGVTFDVPYFSREHIRRAAAVAGALGIPHHVVDAAVPFEEEVAGYFVSSYINGLTPNPCMRCNQRIKFGFLLAYARAQGFSSLASGHYARIVSKNGDCCLFKGSHDRKSQEYFLALLSKKTLSFLLFPLSGMTKDEVRKKIQEGGWYPFPVRESQDICFISGKSYPEFIEEHVADHARYGGAIRHRDGGILGTHKGIYAYTYGQRGGLGIGAKEPLYVIDIDPRTKEIIVAQKRYLEKGRFILREVNWLYPPRDYAGLTVKIRYNAPPLECSIRRTGDRSLECVFKDEKAFPSPGQYAVFYDNDAVVAGGMIAKQ